MAECRIRNTSLSLKGRLFHTSYTRNNKFHSVISASSLSGMTIKPFSLMA